MSASLMHVTVELAAGITNFALVTENAAIAAETLAVATGVAEGAAVAAGTAAAAVEGAVLATEGAVLAAEGAAVAAEGVVVAAEGASIAAGIAEGAALVGGAIVSPVGLAVLAGTAGVAVGGLVWASLTQQTTGSQATESPPAATNSNPQRVRLRLRDSGRQGQRNQDEENSRPPNRRVVPHEWSGFHRHPERDRDLTGGNPNREAERGVLGQLLQAFNEARMLIEQGMRQRDHRRNTQARGHQYFPPAQWAVTIVDCILVRNEAGELDRVAFPVEMTARTTIEVDPGVFVEYQARLDLDNPSRDYEGQGPRGPHVGYDFDRVGGEGPRGHAGHIFLNVNIHLPHRHRGMDIQDFRNLMQDYREPIRLIHPLMLINGALNNLDFLLVRIGMFDDMYDEDLQLRVNFELIAELFEDRIDQFPLFNIFRFLP